jgi:tetratricopeptide (TPR) repeat protein
LFNSAIAEYSEIIKLNPDDGDAYHRRGVVYIITDRPNKGIKDIRQAVRIDPTNEEYRDSLELALECH